MESKQITTAKTKIFKAEWEGLEATVTRGQSNVSTNLFHPAAWYNFHCHNLPMAKIPSLKIVTEKETITISNHYGVGLSVIEGGLNYYYELPLETFSEDTDFFPLDFDVDGYIFEQKERNKWFDSKHLNVKQEGIVNIKPK